MTDRCRDTNLKSLQRGAALIVALTLIAAVSLLATAAIHESTIDAAMTRNFAARVDSRLATRSAIETYLAEGPLPLSGEFRHRFRIDDNAQSQVLLSVRYLGNSVRVDHSGDDTAATIVRHYEITAEAAGLRNSRHRRRLYYSEEIHSE